MKPDVSAAVEVLQRHAALSAGLAEAGSMAARRVYADEAKRFEAAIALLEAAPRLLAVVRAAQAVCERRSGFIADEIDEALAALPPEVRAMVEETK